MTGRGCLAWAGLAAFLLGAPAVPSPAAATDAVVSQAQVRIAERTLFDTEGRPVRFGGGAVGGGAVAILSFTYTGCTTICPVADLVMNGVEGLLAARGRDDLRLLTLTIDPFNDTPDRLAARVAEVGSGPGRMWLTGEPGAVFSVLDGLGLRYGRLEAHDTFFLVVDRRGRRVLRVLAEQADPELLLRLADGLR